MFCAARRTTRSCLKPPARAIPGTSSLNGQDASHPDLLGLPFTVTKIPVFFDKDKFPRGRCGPEPYAINFLYADQHIQNFFELP